MTDKKKEEEKEKANFWRGGRKKLNVSITFKKDKNLDPDSYKQPAKAEAQILWEVIPEHLIIKWVIFLCHQCSTICVLPVVDWYCEQDSEC